MRLNFGDALKSLAGRAHAKGLEPVDRGEIRRQQAALNVSLEESGFEITEDAVAVETVVSGGETAGRHGRDQIHFVKQPADDSPAVAEPEWEQL